MARGVGQKVKAKTRSRDQNHSVMIEAEAEGFARLESQNCGKPYARVLADEIPAIVDCFRFFAGAARCMNGSAVGEYVAGHTSMIRRDAIGVVAAIAPWNYPLMMVAWKISPALAASNTVVLKPSKQTAHRTEARWPWRVSGRAARLPSRY